MLRRLSASPILDRFRVRSHRLGRSDGLERTSNRDQPGPHHGLIAVPLVLIGPEVRQRKFSGDGGRRVNGMRAITGSKTHG
jgi:hypothetical protein